MRLNVEWVAPWRIGPPIKYWIWHTAKVKSGIIRGKPSWSVTILGFYCSLTKDALFNGIGLSINW